MGNTGHKRQMGDEVMLERAELILGRTEMFLSWPG